MWQEQKSAATILGKTQRVTYSNNSFAKAQGSTAAVLRLILGLVVAQSVIFQYNPTVLPAVDVVCPLKIKQNHNE